MVGRAAGNRGLDHQIDRLESTLDKFSDTLQRLTSALDSQNRSTASSGTTQQSSTPRGNGGGATFNGQPSHTTKTADHRADQAAALTGGGGYQGSHRANGGGWSFGGGGGGSVPPGGAHSAGWGFGPGGVGSQAYQNAGGASGIAMGGLKLAAAGTAVYTINHAENQYTTQSLATQAAYGSNWRSSYNSMFRNNYTAASNQDAASAAAIMRNGGFTATSGGYARMRAGVESTSYLDPSLTNTQVAQATISSQGVGVTNRALAFGMDFSNKSTREIANQILMKVPGQQNIKSAAQVEAALGPRGGIGITLDDAVRSGLITPDMQPVILSEIRSILKARLQGISPSQLGGMARAASQGQGTDSGGRASNFLNRAGFGNSLVQTSRTREGFQRGSEAETIGGFEDSVKASTGALDEFRQALNAILGMPGVGYSVGAGSGVMSTMGGMFSSLGFGGLLGGKLMAGLGGDGPGSMASGAMMYAGGGDGPSSLSSGAASYGGSAARTGTGGTSTGSARGAGSKYSLGAVKPWVAAAAAHLGPMFGIGTVYGVGSRSTPGSDHPKGLALDFMCGKSAGDKLAAYARANHKRLNITYIIWRQRIWSINYPGWRQMEDRGSPTANHYDHVHISFLASPSNADLGGLPAGGGIGGGNKAGGGGGLGQGGSSSDIGGSQFTGTSMGGASSAFGGFTEVGALGLGGGGAAAMGMAPGASSAGGGGGGGGTGGMGGPGSGGSARIGSYNVLESTRNSATQQDLRGIMGKVDVLAMQEVIRQKEGLAGWIKKQGWGYYKGPGEAAVAWDKDDYNALKTGYKVLNTTHGSMPRDKVRHAAYVLLQDKDSGAKFWQVSAHTVPGGGPLQDKIRKEQYAALANLQKELGRTGIPVVLAGDINDRTPGIKGFGKTKFDGIDHIMGSKGVGIGSHGSNHGGMSSDHPFVWANVNLPGGQGGGSAPKGNGGTPAQNMALGRAMAAQRGWTGSQWDALRQLWMKESGWRTHADNPSSSAYGIPQAMTSVHNMPKGYMDDPRVQIRWGLNYIKDRYGNPAGAWSHSKKTGWYAMGEWNIRDDQDARVHKGEMILPSKVAEAVRNELTAPGIRGVRGGNGGVEVVFQADSIRVIMPSGATKKDGREFGKGIMESIAEDVRWKALAEG